ncbi:MAG: Regulatory protein ArsR [Candidatus Shapirobacteria bacterium GW2011_GWF1_38_23]|nr:MAG: Regulatory protein ArsR [Candidatus Shapirobacteria bacterium GW2011_GWF2_37_20]KKQ65238.1 MAG: Regulatory protein ArsR [Candidatus Shapirobacteria bacterium GW2011_GWF1_38_23]
MDKIYKAMAEINRRKIVYWLGFGELNVSEIVKKLNLSQATVSNHLSVLRKAGLVNDRVKGKERIYKLNLEKAELFVKELNRLMQLSSQKLGDEIIIRR